jgi:glutamate/tyrosine decarboxylase-like PLP-dependent enzyme
MSSHAELFARAAHHATRFRDTLPDRPPRPVATASELRSYFASATPERGDDPMIVLEELVRAAEPGLAAPAGKRFFGWVIGASHPAGVAADMLTSAWGQNAGLHAASPAAAAAEAVAGRWLLDILRLPSCSSVGFVTGGAMANFTCLAAARHRVLAAVGWNVAEQGLAGAPRIRTFVGEAAHVTVDTALRHLGLGLPTVRVRTDEEGRMDPTALREALQAGDGPAIVIAQAGQINTGAFDAVGEIGPICRAAGAWLHVDGAFGLWARAAPEFNRMTSGLELADSWAVDGHKWLQIPYDSGFAIVRDPVAHRAAMGLSASYLPPARDDEHDPGQYVPELSRRARGFPTWAMLRTLGREGIATLVRRHCVLARTLAARLRTVPGLEVLNNVELNQVLVAFGDGEPAVRDSLTRAVIARLQDDGVCFAGGAEWQGRWVLRLSVISHGLEEADIYRLAHAIIAAWDHVQTAKGPGWLCRLTSRRRKERAAA